jgi:hypothetical protein
LACVLLCPYVHPTIQKQSTGRCIFMTTIEASGKIAEKMTVLSPIMRLAETMPEPITIRRRIWRVSIGGYD